MPCRANIKVSSTETGAIFGSLVYEGAGYGDRAVVVLNDIHIDIMDYISPASCTDVQFRSMWAEFEWENKVRHARKQGAGAVSFRAGSAGQLQEGSPGVLQLLCKACIVQAQSLQGPRPGCCAVLGG